MGAGLALRGAGLGKSHPALWFKFRFLISLPGCRRHLWLTCSGVTLRRNTKPSQAQVPELRNGNKNSIWFTGWLGVRVRAVSGLLGTS